jgi:hypothetical protein
MGLRNHQNAVQLSDIAAFIGVDLSSHGGHDRGEFTAMQIRQVQRGLADIDQEKREKNRKDKAEAHTDPATQALSVVNTNVAPDKLKAAKRAAEEGKGGAGGEEEEEEEGMELFNMANRFSKGGKAEVDAHGDSLPVVVEGKNGTASGSSGSNEGKGGGGDGGGDGGTDMINMSGRELGNQVSQVAEAPEHVAAANRSRRRMSLMRGEAVTTGANVPLSSLKEGQEGQEGKGGDGGGGGMETKAAGRMPSGGDGETKSTARVVVGGKKGHGKGGSKGSTDDVFVSPLTGGKTLEELDLLHMLIDPCPELRVRVNGLLD